MAVLDGFEPQWRPRLYEVTLRVTQKAKEKKKNRKKKITWTLGCCCMQSTFFLCLQPVVPLVLLRTGSLSVQTLTCPISSPWTTLIKTHNTSLTFLRPRYKSSPAPLVTLHAITIVGLEFYIGGPKICKKNRCMSTTETFNFYLLCKEGYCTQEWVTVTSM